MSGLSPRDHKELLSAVILGAKGQFMMTPGICYECDSLWPSEEEANRSDYKPCCEFMRETLELGRSRRKKENPDGL